MGLLGLLGLLGPLLLSACQTAPTAPTAPTATVTLVARGSRGAVVTGEPQATAVGVEVLRSGGNAVDAAVAVALTLAVTHPQAGNLGGGGFLVLRMADGRTAALDFRETAPAAARRDMYLREDGSVHPENSRWGVLAGGVPGTPAGVVAVLERFGSRPLLDLARPAIDLARRGFRVDRFLAADLAAKSAVLGRFPSTRAVFFVGDRPLREGAWLVQPDLAETLMRFAHGGHAGFYRGETARRFVADQDASGGLIRAGDLAAYQAVWREPLRTSYRGCEVLAMPPPSSGGVALLQMLNVLSGYDLHASGRGTTRTLHWMIAAMRCAYADRARWLGDPDHYPVPVEGLLAAEYAARLRASIAPDRVTEVTPGRPTGIHESDHTTHFSIVDAAGNAVSCTTTINSTFGSGMVVAGTGFLLNNEMDDFSAKPGVPNQFGLVGGEANAIAPGKRMLSSMTPTIVTRGGELKLVLGSPGGGRIINTVLQVVIDVIDHGLTVDAAVRAPRIHHQWRPDHLCFEPDALSAEARAGLTAIGHAFAAAPTVIGRCQAIEIAEDGSRTAAADPRSGGAAAVE